MSQSESRPRATLIKPPPPLSDVSPIETLLRLHPLTDISPTTYTNAHPLWHPPGARGIYGGAAIAQSLSAAQASVPSDFTVHSMHCYFVLAGNAEIPVLYEVERVRDGGHSFATRTVQARQRGRCIFTTTISFMREGRQGETTVEHQCDMPVDVEVPPDGRGAGVGIWDDGTMPFESVLCKMSREKTGRPEEKRTRQWIRAKGRISDVQNQDQDERQDRTYKGLNHQAHLSALAYMSDSFFVGTVARVHNLLRISMRANIERSLRNSQGSDEDKQKLREYIERTAPDEEPDNVRSPKDEERESSPKAEIGMMVSLDHSIFFHNPKKFRADEWMLSEMDSPWAGAGRGLVFQRMWSKDGILIATCVQEGLVRLKQDREHKL
jgi:acyl-CoA thioesterase 8